MQARDSSKSIAMMSASIADAWGPRSGLVEIFVGRIPEVVFPTSKRTLRTLRALREASLHCKVCVVIAIKRIER